MRVLAALIASLTLPAGGVQWWSVAPAGRSVLVTGSAPSGRACEFYVVRVGTFTGRGPYKRACGRPPVTTHAIVPVVVPSRTSPYYSVTVAGRVVMRYRDASDTRPQYAWYGHSLWIYDVVTVQGAEVLRLDAHNGALRQRTAMPKVFRPVMVANGDGLWLDPATNGGISGVEVAPLFHVALDAARPVAVHRGGRAAMWMVASAHAVWFEQIAGLSSVSIWRVNGTHVRLLARPRNTGFAAAYGAGRLWELTCGPNVHVVRIDPSTGASTVVAQFRRTFNYCDASMTVARGDVFVLEGRKLYAYK